MAINVSTAGYLATLWRVHVTTVLDAARKTGVEPTLVINGLPHYRDVDAAEMMMFLADRGRLPEGV